MVRTPAAGMEVVTAWEPVMVTLPSGRMYSAAVV
jgi:hypothetical protein